MGDDITIGVTEITNLIEVTSQPNDQIIDIGVTDNTDNVTINVTPSVIEINIIKGTGGGGSGAVSSVNGYIGDVVLTKTDLGLGNVDNTSDLDKPISTATQSALDLKVPYTGATSNVNLGEFQLSTGQITFDQTPTQSAGVGVMRWNDTDGTLDLGLKGGNVTLQLGQEQVVRIVNKTGSNLTEAGYQAVYTSGAQGQRLKVDLALANADLTSAGTLGIVTENIAVNQEGFVTTNGLVRGINTTGSLQGETWIDGDILYLSPNIAGRITNIKPIAPQHLVVIGVCVYAHITQGSIFVKVDNGYELDELHNVLITAIANNEGLFYETSTGLWKNKSISTILGYTPVSSATTISTTSPLSGGGDLSANRTLSISQSNTTTNGYLSSVDWNTFNNKQSALSGTGFVKSTAGVISYDTNTYLTSAVTTLSGGATGLTPNTATSGAIILAGTLVVANGGTGSTTASGARTNLGATTVGANIFTSINPTAITFLRANADNTVSWLDAATFRTAIGAGTSTVTPSALTKVDDTNVTLTLGGTPATALLQGVSLTLGWTGTLADGRIASASTWNSKQAALSGTGIVKSTAGVISYLTDNSTNWDSAYTNRITSLTTTGSSGASTLISNVLNIPTYTLSGLGGQALSTNLTSLSGLTFASTSFVKMTAAGTFALDTTAYTSNLGTVTSVAAITLGTTGTDLSSTVSTGTTTPVITLNVPTASATNRGALSSADWSTFNGKQNALTNPITGTGTNGYVSFWNGTNTHSADSNFFWDNTNKRLGLGTVTPSYKLHVQLGQIYVGENYGFRTYDATNGGDSWQFGSNSGDFSFNNASQSTTPLTIKSGGNVLMGTATDDGTNKLQVNGSVNIPDSQSYKFGGGTTKIIGNSGANALDIQTNNTSALFISATQVPRFSALATGTTTQMVTTDLNGNLGYQAIPSSGGSTNLSYTASSTNGIVVSDTGTDATIPLATGTNAGLLKPADFTQLSTLSSDLAGKQNTLTNPITGTGTGGGVAYFTGTSTIASSTTMGWSEINQSLSLLGTDTDIILKGITNEPSTPSADNITLYAKKIGGKMVLKTKDEYGVDFSLQNSFWDNNITYWSNTNATAGIWQGTVGAGAGTFTQALPTTTSIYTSIKRARYANVVTTTNQVLGQRNTEAMFFRGGLAGVGGFFFYVRFGFDVFTNGSRLFAGFHSGTTVISADPSALNNTMGFCIDAADNGLISFLTRGTVATKASTGFTAVTGKGYDVYMYAAPNGSTIYWKIEDLNAGTEASGSATLNLPTNTTMLTAGVLASNAALTTVTATQLGINKIYIETDY